MIRPDGDHNSRINIPEDEVAIASVCDDLVDEVILGTSFEVHRAVKMGTFLLDEMDEMHEKDYQIVDEIGLDVFGQVPMKKQLECVCPNCQRNLAASRFAPHLEKCMGMGRSSSRIANRRIANSGKDAGSDDDENDDDWTYGSDRRGAKKKREKTNHSPRRSKSTKLKNGDTPNVNSNLSDGGGGSFANYEAMTIDERKALLTQMCGVISEHTKKMCTRSHRCPQHTDEQRKSVRIFLLGQQGAVLDLPDDIHVDIDTYDDLDGQILRDSLGHLWDAGPSTNSSPTDSNSTNNSSSSSRKKDKKIKNSNSARNKKPTNSGGNQSNNKGKTFGASSSQGASSSSVAGYEV